MGPLTHKPASLELLFGGLNTCLVGALVAVFVFAGDAVLPF